MSKGDWRRPETKGSFDSGFDKIDWGQSTERRDPARRHIFDCGLLHSVHEAGACCSNACWCKSVSSIPDWP